MPGFIVPGTFDPVGNLAGNVPVGFPLHVASPHAAAAAAEEINPDAAHSDATEPQPLAPLTFLAGVQAAKRQQAVRSRPRPHAPVLDRSWTTQRPVRNAPPPPLPPCIYHAAPCTHHASS